MALLAAFTRSASALVLLIAAAGKLQARDLFAEIVRNYGIVPPVLEADAAGLRDT